MAATKKTAKKAAKKTTRKTKHYAAPVVGMVNVDTRAPMITTVEVDDPDLIKRLDASDAYVEVTKKEAEKINAANENAAFEDIQQQLIAEFNDLKGGPNKSNAGDYIFAILLFGSGFAAGALLL